MAAAIRKISIARGHDVTRYTLACFGGAGGQHACRVADALGMERILIHPLAGVLSAYGIGIADVKAIRETSWLKPLGEDFSDALTTLEAARARALGRAGHSRRADRAESPRAAADCRAATRRSKSRSRRAERDARATSPSCTASRFGYVDEAAPR